MERKRKTTSFSITAVADDLLNKLAAHHGITKTSVIEMIVREEARKLGMLKPTALE